LLPGDMGVILSDTGVGKTTILSNLARSQAPRTTLFFELELSAEAMCERFIALTTRTHTMRVEHQVRAGDKFDVSAWRHVWICPESRMTLEQMETFIMRSELRTQQKPRLVLIDYIGLMGAGGAGKRYERLSTIAEGLKVLAKSTNTVIVVASQIRRPAEGESTEVGLHDAKDSGSIECSAQLVISATRPGLNDMKLSILKQTKRAGRKDIMCNFDGDLQLITERTEAYEGH
jgi:replicative DNA helicase